jgi:transporter family-2 protein
MDADNKEKPCLVLELEEGKDMKFVNQETFVSESSSPEEAEAPETTTNMSMGHCESSHAAILESRRLLVDLQCNRKITSGTEGNLEAENPEPVSLEVLEQIRPAISLDANITLDKHLQKTCEAITSGPPKTTQYPAAVAIVLALVAGVSVIVQTGINTSLNATYCPSALATSATSFLFGAFAVAVTSIVHRPCWDRSDISREKKKAEAEQTNSESEVDGNQKELEEDGKTPNPIMVMIQETPWYAYMGGIFGAAWVTSAIYLAPKLGFATFQLAATAGQLLSGIVCDSIGLLHLTASTPTPWRVICTLFVVGGTALSAKWGNSASEETHHQWKIFVYIFLSALAGSVFPVQACVNYELAKHVGTPYRAVTVNFIIGGAIMWTLVFFEFVAFGRDGPIYEEVHYEDGSNDDEREMEWWMWIGGFFGGVIVASVTIGIPCLGAVFFTIIFISAQLVSAIVADALGAFHYPVIPLNAGGGRRLVGAVLATIAAAAFNLTPPAKLTWLQRWPCEKLNVKDYDSIALEISESFRV